MDQTPDYYFFNDVYEEVKNIPNWSSRAKLSGLFKYQRADYNIKLAGASGKLQQYLISPDDKAKLIEDIKSGKL